MKKLYQLNGLGKAIVGDLGIEIEAEGKYMEEVHTNFWHSEDDGSLRGHYPETRAEFVLNKPIKQDQVVKALQELVAALPEAQFDFSYRTSVHVHVNVQEFTHTQILNMVYTYMLLEEPFMTYCGKARKGNRFCLRLSDAEGLMDLVKSMIEAGEGSHGYLCGDNHRYSAINLAALGKYGSIEFRGMRGNIEIPVIHTWTRALMAVREYAGKQESPKTIMAEVEKLGAKKFMERVLGAELYASFIYPRIVKDMARSYSISLDLPYTWKPPAPEVKVIPGQVVVNEFGDKFFNGINFIKNTNNLNLYSKEGVQIVLNGAWFQYRNGHFATKGIYNGPMPPEAPKAPNRGPIPPRHVRGA